MNQRWALFISGRGSNAQAVLDLAESVRVSLVVTSKANVGGVARARRLGIPVLVLPHSISWVDLHKELLQRGIQRIFLLGFMKLIPASFVSDWRGQIWNLHPSLLPRYPGLHSIERSFEDQGEMGVTIHEVSEEMDAGARRIQLKSVSVKKRSGLSFSRAQLLISRDEQRAVRQFVEMGGRC
jgi:phosphoribosylglycinamide formyltransferase-1